MEEQMTHRIFFTGATGVVGRIAVPMLVRLGHRVTAVGRNPQRLDALRAAGADILTIDLFDRGALRAAVAGHDVIVNLATHMPSSLARMSLPWSWRENDRVRRDGSALLAQTAIEHGIRRFVQESFAPIYEDGGTRWIDDTWPVRPARYNRSTLDAERSAQRVTDAGGAGIVLRFAGFYGPDAMLRDMLKIVRRGWSPLPGEPSAYWSSIAHEDAARAVVACIDVDPGIYNVCDDRPLTRREWADAAAQAIAVPSPRLMPAWLARLGGSAVELMSRSQRMSNAKLRRATGWAPLYGDAAQGLRDVAVRLAEAPTELRAAHSS
jgi:nucleoside-diphosphate-sugar epimerase